MKTARELQLVRDKIRAAWEMIRDEKGRVPTLAELEAMVGMTRQTVKAHARFMSLSLSDGRKLYSSARFSDRTETKPVTSKHADKK